MSYSPEKIREHVMTEILFDFEKFNINDKVFLTLNETKCIGVVTGFAYAPNTFNELFLTLEVKLIAREGETPEVVYVYDAPQFKLSKI
jgi:hypothetical protein